MHLRYYVSDPGYGHASRAIALIRELKRLSPKLSVSVRTSIPASYIHRSLSHLDVKVTRSANDIDLRFDAGLYCDLNHAYKENIEKFSGKLEAILREEHQFYAKNPVDLIISDIAAYPFHLGLELGVPSIAVASFVWSWFLRELLDIKDPQVEETVGRMDGFYGSAARSFSLPFSCDLSSLRDIQDVSLLVKKTTRSTGSIRKALGYKESDFIIFLTGGFTLPWPTVIKKLPNILTGSNRVKFILSSNAPIPGSEEMKRIPQNDMEIQDYVAASDLVVSKPGHSIISESIANRVPLILTLPTRHPEWELNLQQLTSKGLATSVAFNEFKTFSWLKSLDELRETFMEQKANQSAYSRNGALEIASSLIEGYDLN